MFPGTNPTLVLAVGYAGSSLLSLLAAVNLLRATDALWDVDPQKLGK